MLNWKFAKVNDEIMDQGPNNSTTEHFKSQDIFSALVRESIQNSLDVVLDPEKPVVVKYTFGKVQDPLLRQSLKDVEEHARACERMYPDSPVCKQMASFLDSRKDDCISYLKVSDFNTKGMAYDPEDNKCQFHSFVQSIGISSKESSGSGGSFGFGKAAYFEFSNTKSILVSTQTPDGAKTFQGSAMLCTHKINEEKYHFSGFYGKDGGKPVQDESEIPEEFRRNEPGSDIILLHVNDEKDQLEIYEESIIKSVLKNFWMAIYKGRLEVRVDWENDGEDDVIVSSESLDELMNTYFPSLQDDNPAYDNPRPYYEAVRSAHPYNENSEEPQKCVFFEEENLNHVGHVVFYLMRNEGTRDRYLRMRKPLMVIDSVKKNGQRGISGVLVCDGEANDYLSKAEPPSHDAWDLKRAKRNKDEMSKKAEKAIRAVGHYADDCITQFFASSNVNEVDVEGLEDYLYATEDPAENKGNQDSRTGTPTDQSSSEETGLHDTTANGPDINPFQKEEQTPGKVTIKKPVANGNNGKDAGSSKTGQGKKNGGNSEHTGGQNVDLTGSESANASEKPQQVLKKVKFRASVQKNDNDLEYSLIIRTENNETLEGADIFISAQGADESEDIPLAWSNVGKVVGNSIRGVTLDGRNSNKIKIKFNDNIKHSISMVVYVTK